MKYIIILLLVFILLPSCGKDTKSKANKVNKLEIIAVKADKPQAHAGEDIIVKSLVGAPEEYNDEFHTIWLLCSPDDDSGFQSCMGEDGIIGLPVIDKDEFHFTVPSDILSQGLEKKKLYVLFTICESDMQTCQDAITDKGGDGLKSDIFKLSYKTVEVIKDEFPITNHNPEIKSIYYNGVELTSDDITLKARKSDDADDDNMDDNVFMAEVTSDSFDEIELPDGEKDFERITFAWKSTLGEIKYYYTDQKHDEKVDDLDENPFNTALTSEVDNYKIYVIALDTNGGIDWKILNVTSEE